MIPRDVYLSLGFKDGAEFDAFFAAENREHGRPGVGSAELAIRQDIIRRAVYGEKIDLRAELKRQREELAKDEARPEPHNRQPGDEELPF